MKLLTWVAKSSEPTLSDKLLKDALIVWPWSDWLNRYLGPWFMSRIHWSTHSPLGAIAWVNAACIYQRALERELRRRLLWTALETTSALWCRTYSIICTQNRLIDSLSWILFTERRVPLAKFNTTKIRSYQDTHSLRETNRDSLSLAVFVTLVSTSDTPLINIERTGVYLVQL